MKFLGGLLVMSLLVFAGCSSGDDSAASDGSGGRGGGSSGGAGGPGAGGESSGGTGGGVGAGGGGGQPSTECPTGFSDDFATDQVSSCWKTLNGPDSANPLIEVSSSAGALHLRAIQGQDGVRYQGSTKSLVYQALTGYYFKVTTTARPRKRSDPSEPPTNALHVGGLMARNPDKATGENYVFIMVGSNEAAQPGVEIKSTTDGSSAWSEPEWSNPEAAELRICRIQDDFYLYKRAPGAADWILADQNNPPQEAPIHRPDLPETLEVGMALNFRGPDNDLDVAFDAIELAPDAPTSADDCTAN